MFGPERRTPPGEDHVTGEHLLGGTFDPLPFDPGTIDPDLTGQFQEQVARAYGPWTQEVNPELVDVALAARDEHYFTGPTWPGRCRCGFLPEEGQQWQRHRLAAALDAALGWCLANEENWFV